MNTASVKGTPEGWMGSKRRRTRRACDVCRRAKVKCNGAYPCEHCVTFEYVCQYTGKFKGSETETRHSTGNVQEGSYEAGVALTEEDNVREGVRHATEEVADDPDLEAFDYTKPRFVSSSSSVAFPRSLGQILESQFTPRLHSFGYNLGIRPEEPPAIRTDLRQITSNDDLLRYSDVCFSNVSPIFDIVRPEYFRRRTWEHFQRPTQDSSNTPRQEHFGAIIAGIIALGSFFSLSAGHPRETELVEYAKRILDDPAAIRRPSVDLVIGWILRTIYLRATTRPNNAWLASCVTMNLAEATGLHSESSIRSLSKGRTAAGSGVSELQAEHLRRIFWIAWSVHNITAFEYGRSSTVPSGITCSERNDGHGTVSDAHLYFQLAQTVQLLNKPLGPSAYEDTQGLVSHGFSALAKISSVLPFITLTKADLCFGFYRRLRQQRFGLSALMITQIISIGNEGLDAALQLAEKQLPWWSVLSTTFQYLCVLLAIDTSTSVKHIARAYQALETVSAKFDTHITREAVTTGRKLVDASIAKRREEIALMDIADASDQTSAQPSVPGLDFSSENDLDVSIEWDNIFGDWYNENISGFAIDLGSMT